MRSRSNTTGSYNTASGALSLYHQHDRRRQHRHWNFCALQQHDRQRQHLQRVRCTVFNTTGSANTASGFDALYANTTGEFNTASGFGALGVNMTGNSNTAIGFFANVASNNLSNATAIGANAVVNASNKIRLGDANVTVIEGQVAYTFPSDKNQKENFQPVDGTEVLRKILGLNLTSWNYIGHDPKEFRHYGPVAQEFFAAFGHDGIGTAGSPTTINSGDLSGILMSAVQELAKQNLELKARLDSLEQLITRDHTGRVASVVEK